MFCFLIDSNLSPDNGSMYTGGVCDSQNLNKMFSSLLNVAESVFFKKIENQSFNPTGND